MDTTDQPLRDKVAIVTGAGRGIGRAIALAYAKSGAAVCCAARSATEIHETARDIAKADGKAFAVVTDVRRVADVERMVRETVDRFGGVDIVVINAGISGTERSVEESDPAAWANVLDVNLLGAYHCARAAIPALKRRGAGKIITIGSGRGHRGAAEGSDYACSKAALWMLTRVLAQELAPSNISVNELIPGPVATRMTRNDIVQGKGASSIPDEWSKWPEDVAPLALFLAAQPDRGPTAQSFSLMRRDN